jgi:hypothetical protein
MIGITISFAFLSVCFLVFWIREYFKRANLEWQIIIIKESLSMIDRWCSSYPQVVYTANHILQIANKETYHQNYYFREELAKIKEQELSEAGKS